MLIQKESAGTKIAQVDQHHVGLETLKTERSPLRARHRIRNGLQPASAVPGFRRSFRALAGAVGVAAGLVLGGCSIGGIGSRILDPVLPGDPPDMQVVATKIGDVFRPAKLPGNPEISFARAAHPSSPAPWVVCLRSDASDPTPVYAVFLQKNDIVSSRIAVVLDGCRQAHFEPVERFVSSSPAEPPAPRPVAR